jgi:hypothetical protein
VRQAGFRVTVLRQTVPTLRREFWYEKQLKDGIDVVICHPKLVETGLDLLWLPFPMYASEERTFFAAEYL